MILPLPLSSYIESGSVFEGEPVLRLGTDVGWACGGAGTTTSSNDEQPDKTASSAEASLGSTVRPYSRLTCTTLPANQHWFSSGSHSAASLPLFWWRLTLGLASVRLSRSDEKRRRVASLAAHRPLSWASERATICSMSVSLVLE